MNSTIESIKQCLKNQQNLEVLGKGQFGSVYKLVYQGKEYAVKKISKKKIDYNEDFSLRDYLKNALLREIDILKKMSEFENSLKFYLFLEDQNDYILILELCDTDLDKYLEKKGRLSSSEIMTIMNGLNKPFKYMHNNDLLHRDIKPENIMIKYIDSAKTKYIPKIADYGLSRKLDDGKATTYLGTPRYMSPEILLGLEYDDKSDLFSIGVMMYELYFHSFPFDMPKNNKEIIIKYNTKKKKDCEDKFLDDLLNRLLAFAPDKRISWEEYFNHSFFNINKGLNIINNQFQNLNLYGRRGHQMINLYDYVLEKMVYYNSNEKDMLKLTPQTKFIPYIECLKHKNEPYFILGILAIYLSRIGISIVIEKDNLPRKSDLKEYHKNIFQFICNSYILKSKYLLDFNVGENKIKYLVYTPIERSKFNEKLKNIIMKIYNLDETEVLIANQKRYQNRFTAVIIIKSNININITKDDLIKVFWQDPELKTLERVDKELLMPIIKLSPSMLFPKEDNKTNKWAMGEKRGGEDYIPPFGWIKYGINIDHGFNDRNYDWINHMNPKGQWCVAYCGITGITKKMEQIFENDYDIKHPGKNVGAGVYCYSDPKIMEQCTEIINANGENYKVGFMVRVKPDKIRASQRNKNVWVVNGNDNEFRPYGILIKRV